MPRLPWDPDAPLDPAALALRVARATGGAPPRLEPFDEGWDNFVLRGPGGMLYRFAKRRAETKHLRAEARLLKQLEGKLPLPVPRVAFAGRDFFACRFIPGASLATVRPTADAAGRVGRALARFLTALHRIPVRGVRVAPRRPGILRRRALRGLARLKRRGVRVPAVRHLLDRVPEPFAGTPVLVHNDLLADHILVRRGRPCGVIDWTDAAKGDPAADFAGLAHWGGRRALDAALGAYRGRVDPGLPARAAYAALCVGVLDVDYGTDRGIAANVRMGRNAIQWAMA